MSNPNFLLGMIYDENGVSQGGGFEITGTSNNGFNLASNSEFFVVTW